LWAVRPDWLKELRAARLMALRALPVSARVREPIEMRLERLRLRLVTRLQVLAVRQLRERQALRRARQLLQEQRQRVWRLLV
jgi:hypothetical protein